MMKNATKKTRPWTVAMCLFLAALPGLRCASPDGEEEESAITEPVPVTASKAVRMTLTPSIDLIGVLVAIPEYEVSLSMQVAGQVASVAVHEGQHVEAGDEILRLDPRLARARMDKANAAIDEAEAALRLLEAGPLPQEIESARQTAAKSRSLAAALGEKLEALEPLRKNGEVSDVRYQNAQAEWDAARAEAESAGATLKVLQAGARPEVLDEARARLASARADAAEATLTHTMCTLTAPIAGDVSGIVVRQGSYVQPDATIVTIVNRDRLFARLRLPASAAATLAQGAPAEIVVPAVSTEPVQGSLARIASVADLQTAEVEASVEIPNPGGALKPGFTCKARVSLPEKPNVIAVPRQSVADRDGTSVVTVVRDNEAFETEVILGVSTPQFVEVQEGLKEGDIVVTHGGYGLPDACPVAVTLE